MYVVCCATHYASTLHPPIHCFAIYSNNLNTVEIFNMMKAHDEYNILLQFVIDLLIQHNNNLCVYHILVSAILLLMPFLTFFLTNFNRPTHQ